jgi:hypothetical protein
MDDVSGPYVLVSAFRRVVLGGIFMVTDDRAFDNHNPTPFLLMRSQKSSEK